MNKMLPVGSVVKIEHIKDHMFMIAGYLVKREGTKFYDYFVVPYPLGLLEFGQHICVNHSSITEVVFEGYSDEQTDIVLTEIKMFKDKLQEPIEK